MYRRLSENGGALTMSVAFALAAYDSYGPTESGHGFPIVIVVLVAIVLIVAWIMAIMSLIDAAEAKGWYKNEGTGKLWFIGLFASPIVLGLYVASLPDVYLRNGVTKLTQEMHR